MTSPGDDHALAMAVVMLLRNPDLAWRLGRRGHGRLGRIFNERACVEGYRELLHTMTRERARCERCRVSPDDPRARRLVEARLGRPPQDALEAAVVLEAWAGVPAQRALETARQLMPRRAAEPLASVAVPPSQGARRGSSWRALAFLVTVVAIALWAAAAGRLRSAARRSSARCGSRCR